MPKGCLCCLGGSSAASKTDDAAADLDPSRKAIPASTLRALVKDRKCSLQDFDCHETVGIGSFGRVRMVKFRCGVAPPAGGEEPAERLPLALKTMKKNQAISFKQVDHVKSERKILASLDHPFIINYLASFQDSYHIYLLLEYVNGGELAGHLRKVGQLPNEEASFFAGEIALALKHLHQKNIVYRDLKPDNVLIDCEGHVKLVDFGFAKVLPGSTKTNTLCGTPEYLAPEIIKQEGHGKPVDLWAFGVLIFEMLAGECVFTGDSVVEIYGKVLAAKIEFPNCLTGNAKDIVKRLLVIQASKRLSFDGVKKHKWCKDLDWNQLPHRKVRPPWFPEVKAADDTWMFDRYPESAGDLGEPLLDVDQEQFAEFG